MFRKKRKQARTTVYKSQVQTIADVFERAEKSGDFKSISPVEKQDFLFVNFYSTLVDMDLLHRSILPYLKENISKIKKLKDIKNIIPLEDIEFTSDGKKIDEALHKGAVVIRIRDSKKECALISIENPRLGVRETNETENEFSVIGPKVGFIEDLNTNLHLLRRQLNTSDLIFEQLEVGTRSKTKVVIAYIEGVTNPQYINTARQRINALDIDVVFDNTQLEQLIADHSYTPFPLYITTERVDRAVYGLISGNIALLTDKSCYCVTGPSTLMDFFSTPEDYYLPWTVASFFRLIRIFGVLFSMFSTAFYVAILTFHFEVVPKDLLGPIIFSRANVPFPPVIEVLFLEITIEFLREAGARLPTKIGQTLGIVGGIVIGQATVEAALTSNILLIVVALAALSSFTTPIYKMSNAVRLLRYPFILLAAAWGGFGIYVGVIFLTAHLMRLKSLGNPYMVPLYPFRRKDFSNTFIRPSFLKLKMRASFLRVLEPKRYEPKDKQDQDEGLNSE